MKIDRVTITGADDSTPPWKLIALNEKYPFVEWGILLSNRQEGSPRFPSYSWLTDIAHLKLGHGVPFKLCGHLCGRWVRDLCDGVNTFLVDRMPIARLFERVQLNFHAEPHHVADAYAWRFINALREWGRDQYVFQFDDVNNHLMSLAAQGGVNVAPLYDTSGGAGVEPETWPRPTLPYVGYAGGLHPEKLPGQLVRIGDAAGEDQRVWIDVETHVRSNDDRLFDLDKVERFLAAAAPHVTP